MTVSEKDWAIVILGISFLIGVSTICYTAYQLYQNWSQQYIVKRRRLIILIIYIYFVYASIIEISYYDLKIIYKEQLPNDIINIIDTATPILRFVAISFILMRLYLLYYDHEYNRSIANMKWQILIDPTTQQSWFIINRHSKYGNHKWLTKYVVIPFIIIYSTIYILLSSYIINKYQPTKQQRYLIENAFTVFYLFIAIILGISCWRKYPLFADVFLIRKEIAISLLIALFILIGCVIIIILIVVFGIKIFLLSLVFMQIGYCSFMYLMTVYGQKAEIIKKEKRKKLLESNGNKVSWNEVIETKEGYENFAEFLQKELSAENLLFVTEYVQLKHAMIAKEALYDEIINELDLNYDLKLPESIPTSLITQEFIEEINDINIHNESEVNKIIFKATNLLFCKYLHQNSMLEVNISSKNRRFMVSMFNGEDNMKTVKTLLPPLEKAAREISALIHDSQNRFRGKTIFTEIQLNMISVEQDSD